MYGLAPIGYLSGAGLKVTESSWGKYNRGENDQLTCHIHSKAQAHTLKYTPESPATNTCIPIRCSLSEPEYYGLPLYQNELQLMEDGFLPKPRPGNLAEAGGASSDSGRAEDLMASSRKDKTQQAFLGICHLLYKASECGNANDLFMLSQTLAHPCFPEAKFPGGNDALGNTHGVQPLLTTSPGWGGCLLGMV
ncbi:hypothetical protein P7K49_018346 [Saguinus oedipus]|uniref:Uncharacterized protein n=1 Tax=Saguinus oedipus TaxID=9490 RepID=A0ABQ9V638_SAGOE|nr:hypothetical protein P7K49_018346 [Saguinus oedipus]